MDDVLSSHIRSVDEDRWLAARFAPAEDRARLMAIYALNYEIARTAEAVKNETLGDIRLVWWRDAIAEIHAGKPARGHPALEAYAAMAPADELLPVWGALIAAREKDLSEAPFEGWTDLQAYAEVTGGGVFKLALAGLVPAEQRPKQFDTLCAKAGMAWAYIGLLRALPYWNARRACFFPRSALNHAKLSTTAVFAGSANPAVRAVAIAVVDRARRAYAEAQDLAALLPGRAFPGIGYLALTPRYIRMVTAPQADTQARAPLIMRQLSLVKASALGRV